MATYYNGAEQPQFNSLDGTVQGAQYAAKPTNRSSSSVLQALSKACAIFYFLLLTAVAVIAFILGGYATARVRSIHISDAVLVSDPKTAPAGYSVFSLGTGLGYWSPAADMIHARSDHGVISYQKYAYLIGGLTAFNGSNATVLRSVVQYDTETGLMYEMKPLPEARYRFAYAQLNGQIYVMGGSSDVEKGTPTNTVFVYNISGNSWSPIGQLQTPRVDPCGAAANGKVYVFGGYDLDGNSLSTVEVCDPSTAAGSAPAVCTQLPARSNLLDARGDCRAVSIDNIIYAMGGAQWFNNTKQNCTANWVYCYKFLNTVEAFNPATGQWSPRAPMISKRGDFGIEALPGGRIIVAGGERGNGTQNFMAMYDVEEYIVQDDIWVQKAPLPEARFRDDLAYVSGRVYAFGGTPTCDLIEGAPCSKLALKTVFAYFDVVYPRLYAFFKPANTNANS
ncbi:hypothetical protein VOLCADRAFT_107594 [Volvox carteri f. nagariensis]|uniref:Kelch repeat protein n=1 Tax=Volvox carteri f. nagariensis TaxID=3068 RepID=D8UEW5_VOLCA|nr:uncharacterized protein VOLCADRAFT_107594 [Volvox carteri f. nagariensis]EFJ41755.1 hypothetical protein VOLCADRAFT_107594 [Volvox carteri f. nagariensis]|eukprot:XP_002957257.1 hypothetical protein VOLCADRAFT_107594 [Volvox carteri f. nagariensis]